MDPYSSPCIIPNNSLHNPVPHSLLRTRQFIEVFDFGLERGSVHPALWGFEDMEHLRDLHCTRARCPLIDGSYGRGHIN